MLEVGRKKVRDTETVKTVKKSVIRHTYTPLKLKRGVNEKCRGRYMPGAG